MPALAVALTLGIFIWVIRRALPDEPDTSMLRQLCIVGAVLLSNILLVLVLPLDGETRGQLLSLLGLVLTAIIALSSTTFVSNAMAGVMLRAVGGFHPGDFISVADHFGRVTERGLLHTEIQSEDRDLMTLPNLFLITHPVKVVHRSGTLISAEVSLGYDIPRKKVRDLLKAAAEEAGLSDPFLQIRALHDHAVAYRIYGLLEDVSSLVTKRSELYAMVLDHLHGADVEIVSPSFVNQRRPDPAQRRLPEANRHDRCRRRRRPARANHVRQSRGRRPTQRASGAARHASGRDQGASDNRTGTPPASGKSSGANSRSRLWKNSSPPWKRIERLGLRKKD